MKLTQSIDLLWFLRYNILIVYNFCNSDSFIKGIIVMRIHVFF